ncbi:hypothetical protein ACFQDG_07580 [Natronoarchaeum mannanilyticum]|uniref:hypothetical protein n=1 Tax=Natronoarchaeum mannanilyticum TaxID=926360 RepID=UPI0031D8BBDC
MNVLLAQKEGSNTVYKPSNDGPNEDIVGYNHRLVLPKADARELRTSTPGKRRRARSRRDAEVRRHLRVRRGPRGANDPN